MGRLGTLHGLAFEMTIFLYRMWRELGFGSTHGLFLIWLQFQILQVNMHAPATVRDKIFFAMRLAPMVEDL